MSSPQPRLGPQANHRLFTVTPDDHRGQIWTITVIFGIFALLVLCMRGFIGRSNLGRDDWSAAAATVRTTRTSFILIYLLTRIQVLDLGQLGCVLAAASEGLGQIDGDTPAAKVGSVSFAWAYILRGTGSTESPSSPVDHGQRGHPRTRTGPCQVLGRLPRPSHCVYKICILRYLTWPIDVMGIGFSIAYHDQMSTVTDDRRQWLL